MRRVTARQRAAIAARRAEQRLLGLEDDRTQPLFSSSATSDVNRPACALLHRGVR